MLVNFNFLDYQTTTAHVNSAYYIPSQNILIKLSIGQYLAGDKGYTLDISRRMPSGWSSGFYFSRTNVSAELFGEGSFDKGFYFYVPIELFSTKYSKRNTGFGLRPITRDGAQYLIHGLNLWGVTEQAQSVNISRDFDDFYD